VAQRRSIVAEHVAGPASRLLLTLVDVSLAATRALVSSDVRVPLGFCCLRVAYGSDSGGITVGPLPADLSQRDMTFSVSDPSASRLVFDLVSAADQVRQQTDTHKFVFSFSHSPGLLFFFLPFFISPSHLSPHLYSLLSMGEALCHRWHGSPSAVSRRPRTAARSWAGTWQSSPRSAFPMSWSRRSPTQRQPAKTRAPFG
jgi:hypothetical protein